jgi:hypothetical protein
MANVLTHMCISLDGFVAQPDDNPAELFDWYWNGDVVVPSAQESMSFSVDAASAQQALNLSLVDELCISQVPVLFGTGIRYFGELVGDHVMLEDPVVIQGTRAFHLRYPVRR